VGEGSEGEDLVSVGGQFCHSVVVAVYAGFLGQFLTQLTSVKTIAAFGDDTTAVLVYYLHTAQVSDAPTAECFTVTDGKISSILLVFDPSPFAPPQG